MAQWYYAIDGRRFGPVSSSQLKDLADRGELSPADLIHKKGQAGWAKASKVKGLFAEQSETIERPLYEEPPQQAVDAAQEAVEQEQPAVVETVQEEVAAEEQPIVEEQVDDVEVEAIEEEPPEQDQAIAAQEQEESSPADDLAALIEESSVQTQQQEQVQAEEQPQHEQSPEDIFADTPAGTEEIPVENKQAQPQAESAEADPFEILAESTEEGSPVESQPADRAGQTDTPADLAAFSEVATEKQEQAEEKTAEQAESDLFPLPEESADAENTARSEEDAALAQLGQEESVVTSTEAAAEESGDQPVDLFAEEPAENPIDALTESSDSQSSAADAPAEGETEDISQLTEEQLFEQTTEGEKEPAADDFADGLGKPDSKQKTSKMTMEEFDSAKTLKLEGLRTKKTKRSRLPALGGLMLSLYALVPPGLAAYFIFMHIPGKPTYSPAVLLDVLFLAGSSVAALALLLSLVGLIAGRASKFSLVLSLIACAMQAVIFLPTFLPGNPDGKQAYQTASLIRFGQAISAYHAANNEMPAELDAVTPSNRMLPGDLKSILLSTGPAGEFFYVRPLDNTDPLTIVAFDKAGLNQSKHIVLYFCGAVAIRTDSQFQDELEWPQNAMVKVFISEERRKIAEASTPAAKPPADQQGPPDQTDQTAPQPNQEDPFPKDGKKSFFES